MIILVSECVPAIHGPNSCTKKSLNFHIMYQQFMVHHIQVTIFLSAGVWIVNCWYTFVHLSFFHEKSARGENAKRLKGQPHSKNKLSSNERARKMQENEPSLTSMRQMVLETYHFKVGNLRKMEVAILKVFSLIFT